MPPSSARLRARPPHPAGREEGGGKWGDKNKLPVVEPCWGPVYYHKRTALMQAACPAFLSPLPCSPSAQEPADSSTWLCQLCLQIPVHPRKTRARGLAAQMEMRSKPHERKRQVSAKLPRAWLPMEWVLLLQVLCWESWAVSAGCSLALRAMASGFTSCLGSAMHWPGFGSWQLLETDPALLQKPETNV